MDTAYFYLTEEGRGLAYKLSSSHPGDLFGKENFKENLREGFGKYDYLICIMATGIVVRILAPLIVHKASDPAVVVLDQKGKHAISLLSGHLGGANDLAREMAFLSGGEAVITTATDVAGELSFDTFAKKHHMAIENISQLKHISGALLEGKYISVVTDYSFAELSEGVSAGKMRLYGIKEFLSDLPLSSDIPTVIIDESFRLSASQLDQLHAAVLYLRPRTICAGIGCKRNMDGEAIEEALLDTLKKEGISPLSLNCISTIPLKADEAGIHYTASRRNVPIRIIPTEEIEQLDIRDLGIASSDFVAKQTGVLSVSTASSYLASGKGSILVDKEKYKGITIALSKMNSPE